MKPVPWFRYCHEETVKVFKTIIIQQTVTAGHCEGTIPLLQLESMTITTSVTAGHCQGTTPHTLAVGVYDHYHAETVTAGHCQGTIALLQWESMTIFTGCYILLVTARVRYHSYSGSLWPLPQIVTAGHCQGMIYSTITVGVHDHYHRLLLHHYHRFMTIPTGCYCRSLPGYDTILTVGVCDHYRRLLLLVTARVRYHSFSGILRPLPLTVTACHCEGTIPLLQWESMTITTDCYCWSMPEYLT